MWSSLSQSKPIKGSIINIYGFTSQTDENSLTTHDERWWFSSGGSRSWAKRGPGFDLGPVQTPNFSWAELNSNLDRPGRINKSTPVDSDAELNSPNLIQFEPKPLVKKPKMLLKYVITIYAFRTWTFRRLNQSQGEILGWARQEERLSRSKFK